MKIFQEAHQQMLQYETRRHFLKQISTGVGLVAMGSLLQNCGINNTSADSTANNSNPFAPKNSPLLGKAKSVIYIHMAGAPSQLELFDYKPELQKMDGQDCPQSFLSGKKFAFIRGVPKMLGSQANFKQNGQSGAWISEYLPHLKVVAD